MSKNFILCTFLMLPSIGSLEYYLKACCSILKHGLLRLLGQHKINGSRLWSVDNGHQTMVSRQWSVDNGQQTMVSRQMIKCIDSTVATDIVTYQFLISSQRSDLNPKFLFLSLTLYAQLADKGKLVHLLLKLTHLQRKVKINT